MKKLTSSVFLSMALTVSSFAFADDDILGKVDTSFNVMGANDHIEVREFHNPDVEGITCHISSARKGGIMASVGLAEDASNASVACRQAGPISFHPEDIEKQKEVFS